VQADSVAKLQAAIRDVHDFPKRGIVFKDITPILGDHALFDLSIDAFLEFVEGKKVDKIVGIDARGFLFGAVVADRLKCGFVPIRKKGKLPHETESVAYSLEYGEAVGEVHKDAITPGENVLIVDDLLATGGTAGAAVDLIGRLQANLLGVAFLIELTFLNGREKLHGANVHSVVSF